MAVVVETTIGDFTIDLFTEERPRTCMNFVKLCKHKYYNLNLLYSVERNFVAQTGDPTGTGRGGDSIFKEMFGQQARLYEGEKLPLLRHTNLGTVSMVAYGDHMYGSQFIVTLGEDLHSLDSEHLVFGQVTEGLDVVAKLNDVLTDDKNRPYQDIRITHTVILDDPYPDPDELEFPNASPEPTTKMLASDYIAVHEDIEDTAGKDIKEIEEEIAQKEAQARATILEMVGDLPDADMAPPENVLFVCKLNPITTSEDLEIIFSRFGKIVCTEVIRDHVTGKSLQYAFIEFEDKKSCEDAYFKMDNVLIDDRRIHVDFSQSVSKVKWRGKGRGVMHFDDRGRRVDGRTDAPPQHRRAKDGDQSKPKSRFIDAAAYQKKYEEEHGSDRRNDHRHRNSERSWRGGRGEESNYDRSGDKQPHHQDGVGNHYANGRNDRHQDDRGNRHQDDRGNRHQEDRNYHYRDERSHRDRRHGQADERRTGSFREVDQRRDRREDDHDGRAAEQRYHTSKRRSSSSSDQEKRKRLMGQLRVDLKNDELNKVKKKKSKREYLSSDASDSTSPERSKKAKKKKGKKNKNKKSKHSSSDSSDSDSDAPQVKKKKKSKKKKKKSSLSSSSDSDLVKELRKKKKQKF